MQQAISEHSQSLAPCQPTASLPVPFEMDNGEAHPFTVLLVDDSPSFLQSALRFLACDGSLEVVGCALNGHEALRQAAVLQPDLVLMDWAMPEMDGLEATRHLKANNLAPCVILLTLHDAAEYREAARGAQADGLVAKADFGVKLLPLIAELLAQTSVASSLPASLSTIAAPNRSAATPNSEERQQTSDKPESDKVGPPDFPDTIPASSLCAASSIVVAVNFFAGY